ncbi:DUF3575 domain-containing protein [Hymenobacter sp. BT523]|uniref:DUF3575 domain-containing protein n=1 Tax=Hymenobacter sp. BT523 TaxID=2795725 RepID=UPI0018EB6A39|nr:DUF3575 domain-containing protein [Hymenobacter sp. BT523]MBJ6111456.1 DUF3575 domain-containing protein [Hymenobacter sp. BT523]
MLFPLLTNIVVPAKNRRLRARHLAVLAAMLTWAPGVGAQSYNPNMGINSAGGIVSPAAGVLTPATSTVTMGGQPANLRLTGYQGSVVKYQVDTGSGFQDMSVGFDQYEIKGTTQFRAVVLTLNGLLLYSTIATVYVKAAEEQPKAVFENRQDTFAPALALKISPLAVLDPIASTLLYSAEYRFSARLGLEASYGQQFTALRPTTLGLIDGRNDYTYSKYKLELRRYLEPRTRNPNQETYVGFQSFFIPQRYTRYGQNFYQDGRYVTYDRAFVQKDVLGFGVKVGSQWHVRTHWLVDVALGLGGRYVETRYDMLNQRKANEVGKSQANIFNQIETPGSRGAIDFELGFKVGYVLSFLHGAR